MPIDKKVFMFEDIITTLIKQKQVSGFVFEGQWHDVGTQINYERAIRSFKT
jgi:NDP-sugar pyrophosphorylase family protein